MKRRMRRMLGLMTIAGMLITAFPTASYAEIPEEQDKSVFEGSEITEDPVPADPGKEMSGTAPELSGQVEDEISDDVPEGIDTEEIETEGIETEEDKAEEAFGDPDVPVILSNNAKSAKDALDGANAVYASGTHILNIELTCDVNLTGPVRIRQGSENDTIVISLNGHSVTGAPGVEGTDPEAACGQTAFIVEAGKFNVEIKGPGSVTGGKGAIVEELPNVGEDEDEEEIYSTYRNYRSGCYGGDAVFFERGCEDDQTLLNYEFAVTGGAVIKGGDGADVSASDWVNNLGAREYTETCVSLYAGAGGRGFGQAYEGGYDDLKNYRANLNKVYLKYRIEDGTVSGGAGGNADMEDRLFSVYEIRNDPEVKSRSGKFWYNEENSFDGQFFRHIAFYPGQGGSGIEYYSGRKHIHVKDAGKVLGGEGGDLICSEEAKTVCRIGCGNAEAVFGGNCCTGKGGDGIVCRGDSGLTMILPALTIENGTSCWSNKTKESNDIGIWIDGIVKGGDTKDNAIRLGSTGDAGSGIVLDGGMTYDYSNFDYQTASGWGYDTAWGILAVGETGTVSGGNAGNAVWGDGGDGGYGISETGHDAACANYLILGTVKGGRGGDSLCGADQGTNTHTSSYPVSLSEPGRPGLGQNGISLDRNENDRKGILMAGNGSITGGDGGNCTERPYGIENGERPAQEAVYGMDEEESTIAPSLTLTDGVPTCVSPMDDTGLSATATMDSFTWDYKNGHAIISLTDNTRVRLAVTLPGGYEGRVYYDWRSTMMNTRSGEYNNQGGRIEYDLGGNGVSFKLGECLLTAEKLIEYGALTGNNGNSTTSIYCYVMLEDGRYVKSRPIIFKNDGNGYNGTNPPAPTPTPTPTPSPTPEPSPVPDDLFVTGISLNAETLTLYPSETFKLSATVNPTGAADKSVTWKSSNEEAVTVDDDGKVTAVSADLSNPDHPKAATAVITASANGIGEDADPVEAKCVVTVLPSEIIDLDEHGDPVNPGNLAVDEETGETKIWTAGLSRDANYYYTGNPVKPLLHVYKGYRLLKEGKDYTLSYKNNTKVCDGEAVKKGKRVGPQVIIKMKGNYSGSKTVYFNIVPMPLDLIEISGQDAPEDPVKLTAVYKAKKKNQLKPVLLYDGKKIRYGSKDLIFRWYETDVEGEPTDVESRCIDPGIYAVKVFAGSGGNFHDPSGEEKRGRRIATVIVTGQIPMSSVKVNGFKKSLAYADGAAVMQPDTVSLTCKVNKVTRTLTENTSEDPENPDGDYTVTFLNNIEPGTATVVYEAIKDEDGNYTGDFCGKLVKTYKVTGKIRLKETAETPGNQGGDPEDPVHVNGDCTVNLEGTDAGYEYRNAAIKPAVTVKAWVTDNQGNLTERTLKQGKDYTVTFKDNKAVAPADKVRKGKDAAPRAVIKGKGIYEFVSEAGIKKDVVKHFAIRPVDISDRSGVVLTLSDVPYNRRKGKYRNTKILFTDRNYRDLKLKAGKDYTVSYETTDGSEAPAQGQKVTVTIRALTDDLGQPKGSCCGEVTEEYRITGNRYTDLSKAKIKINPDAKGKTRACTYTGSAIEPGGAGQPELVITTGKGRNLRVLTQKTEYTEGDYEILGYYNNIGKGNSAVILLRGLGDFRGVRAVKFSISASPVDAGWSGVFR